MHEKLLKIQSELKVPKSQTNSFGRYKYRSCEDIIEAVKPLCHAQGVVLTISDEIVSVGNRIYVKATATLTITDLKNRYAEEVEGGVVNALSPKRTVSVTGWAREEETKKGMDGSQITGAASSYARKYALNGLFAIDDTKDSDATNTGSKKEVDEAPPETEEDLEF